MKVGDKLFGVRSGRIGEVDRWVVQRFEVTRVYESSPVPVTVRADGENWSRQCSPPKVGDGATCVAIADVRLYESPREAIAAACRAGRSRLAKATAEVQAAETDLQVLEAMRWTS